MKELKEGVEIFDGREVAEYAGRFSGTFDLDAVMGTALAHDDLVSFIVTARVSDAKFTTSKTTGIQKRINTLEIEEASALDPEKALWLYDQLGKVVAGVNELTEDAPVPEGQPTLLGDWGLQSEELLG